MCLTDGGNNHLTRVKQLMMNTIEVKKLESVSETTPLEVISEMLDRQGSGNDLDNINWQGYRYKPEVRFNIAWGDREIYLKYYVREKNTRAEKTRNNEMVCEDSCVEFFVSPSDDGIYYNFEFNPIGTALVGSGHGRHDSARAEGKIVDGIRRLSSIGTKPFSERSGDISWTLTLAIPLSSFFNHDIKELRGKTFSANFYKCGDKLSVPHYVTWNPVTTEKPDYHRPEFFGVLKFV